MPELPAYLPNYAELHCLSNFSFLRGASHPQELIERAQALGYRALAITDECSVAGAARAWDAIKKLDCPPEKKIKLIIGTQIILDDGMKLVLLATDRQGYGNLCTLITRGRMHTPKGSYRLTRDDLTGGLPGCLALLIPTQQPYLEQARFVAEYFPGRAWIAVGIFSGPNDTAWLDQLSAFGKNAGLPLVAAGDVHMHVRSRKPLQDVLTAIRLGTTVGEAGYALFPNGERHLRHRLRLARLYPPALLAETLEVAARCIFDLDTLQYEYPDEIVPPGYTPTTYLRELTEQGLLVRYPQGVSEKVRGQIEKELALIAEKRYEPFFLTVYDVVKFARQQNILCQGRGSAANSAVCYALGITSVNPDRANLLFERFLSRERNEPPDIDVDFEHQRREEVIQYIYRKYGRDRAALAATLITYRRRSALRDVGKALGLSQMQVDRLAKSLAWWDKQADLKQRLNEAGFDIGSREISQLLVFVDVILGFPRHLSQHVGGFVISRGPLARLVPIENASMPERTVIQWDKDDLETLGLLKVDVLALGMLTAIRRALTMVAPGRQPFMVMQEILDKPEDQKVYEMIQKADTIGVFQIESRAQMSMLPRLRPNNFYDLVVQIAIVRPGPIQGGMVHPYLRRRQGLEPVSYPSNAIKNVLERTLGVSIFQEQVMQIAMVAAGFTADEADGLRRAMAAWRRKGTLEKFEKKLKDGMQRNGYSANFSNAIWEQTKGFGEYGFPESHSASFALLAYISSWLKYHRPAAFLAALLNSQPMGFYAAPQLVQDARRHGVTVLPVDATVSDYESTLESAATVRLGLLLVGGLSEAGARSIISARTTKKFSDIDDLARRAMLSLRELQSLAAAGALELLAGHRRNAHWFAAGAKLAPHLLRNAPVAELLPSLNAPTESEAIMADYANPGLTLRRHPLALLRPRLQRMKMVTAAELSAMDNGKIACTAGIVTCRQRPGTTTGVVFVTIEDETGYVNVVIWNKVANRQRRELLGSQLLGVRGKVQKEGDVVHLIAYRLVDHNAMLDGLETQSRNFH